MRKIPLNNSSLNGVENWGEYNDTKLELERKKLENSSNNVKIDSIMEKNSKQKRKTMNKISSITTKVPSNLVPPAVIAIQNCKIRKNIRLDDLQFSQFKTDLYLSFEDKAWRE